MASITINFNATTLGYHILAYRKQQTPSVIFTEITINVTTLGIQQYVINLLDNLYCADAVYEGYVIANCQNKTDSNGDGYPDLATPWSVTALKQDDPIKKYNIKLRGYTLDVINITTAGAGTGEGSGTYDLIFSTADPTHTIIPAVATVDYDNVVGAHNVIIINPGVYITAPDVAIDNIGSTATFSATLVTEGSPLVLSDYVDDFIAINSGHFNYNLDNINDTFILYAKENKITLLPADYEATVLADGHCEPCREAAITEDPAVATGNLYFVYMTPWSGTNPYGNMVLVANKYSMVIDNVHSVGCQMKDSTIVNDCITGTTITESPCS